MINVFACTLGERARDVRADTQVLLRRRGAIYRARGCPKINRTLSRESATGRRPVLIILVNPAEPDSMAICTIPVGVAVHCDPRAPPVSAKFPVWRDVAPAARPNNFVASTGKAGRYSNHAARSAAGRDRDSVPYEIQAAICAFCYLGLIFGRSGPQRCD
jgi:hypothetical protein